MRFASSNTKQQIKQRYHVTETINNNDGDELDFDCYENRENNEKQLFKRISNLQQPGIKKCK
jgi:hypothetical protein